MQKIMPLKNSLLPKSKQIELMFDDVAGQYDSCNKIITFGMDRLWRKKAVALLTKNNPERILDVATGTGDMLIELAGTNATKIVGIDISQGMLEVARTRLKNLNIGEKISLELQNSEDIRMPAKSFDAVCVSFGIRNFENLTVGLTEIYRVLTDKGTLVVLETSVPKNRVVRLGYSFYTKRLLPLILALFSKKSYAYKYLTGSAIKFPCGNELIKNI
jgi:demethylmenaquinone methyltransferase/2-methoxy-6-polyprenyl-1,4-benzoquinol methylase